LDYLATTRSVQPARLPDVIALDLADVPAAAQAGLIQPLDAVLPADVSADLFPMAYQAGRVRGRWVAVPFAVDVEHLVYNKNAMRQVPATWDEFTKQKGSLLLPLGGDDAFLLQYLALGASLVDATNQPGIDPNAAAQTLAFFKRARDLGLIPDAALQAKSVDQVWTGFAAGQASMAQVAASRYLAERAKTTNANFASVPTREGSVATLATGYAIAIVTTNPTRQAAAARFIQWIILGERLAPWLRAVHLLPANRGTMVLAVDPPEYASFLREQLENASLFPSALAGTRQADAWRAAISAVWKGQQTPEEAARLAASSR
jgi:ABC-type glycerol-3-phosphate transport system substrate-binding protein